MFKRTAIIVLILAIVAVPYSFSDEVRVPFAIYLEDFKAEAKENGFDLYDTRESHGFIENKGGRFTVCTYRSVTQEQLDLIKELTWKHLRKPNA